jgi:hypothetical protein
MIIDIIDYYYYYWLLLIIIINISLTDYIRH